MPTLNSWVTCPKPNPQALIRLFCFPYAGGSSLIFRNWSDKLAPNIEVCAIELPGRGIQMKLAPFNQLEPLVKAIAPALLSYLDKPFAFFGHSMGGLVSFELARLLRNEYRINPAHLFISGRRAPTIPDTKPPIHDLPELDFKEELRRLNGTPSSVLDNPELMQLLLPMLRADFAVLETYVYKHQQPLDCPITVFGGLEDTEVSHDNLLAWQEHTKASFSIQMFDGDHFFIHSAQELLLKTLAESLKAPTFKK